MINEDFIAQMKREMKQRSQIEAELEQMRKVAYSNGFIALYGRVPTDDELSRFIELEKAREAEKRRQRAASEKELNALLQRNAEQYDLWFERSSSKLARLLESQKPDQAVALRKFIENDESLKKLQAAGDLSIGLPWSEPDLTGEAKAAFRKLCQNFVCRSLGGEIIGRLEEHLDWKPKGFFVSFPHAEFLDEDGIPCLLFVAEPCGIIVIEISKKPSFQKSVWLYSVKDKNGHEEKVDEHSFTFTTTAPYLLGYYWTDIIPLDWSTESLLVPVILLDALANGQIEVEGVKVRARFGASTSYNVKGCDETIEISDGFTEFLRRLKPPWYQDMASLGVIDNSTSEIVKLKLLQATPAPTASQRGWSDDDLIDALTRLGLRAAEAKEKLKILKEKNIDHNITLEEAVKLAFKE